MSAIGRPCVVCGARTAGESRCETHQVQTGRHRRSCLDCGAPSAGDRCPLHDTESARNQRQPYRRYDHPTYRRNARKVRQRAGGNCEQCGRRRRLHVHHILPVKAGLERGLSLEELHSKGNLIALCTGKGSCHAKAHSGSRS